MELSSIEDFQTRFYRIIQQHRIHFEPLLVKWESLSKWPDNNCWTYCGKFKCGHRRKIATILTKSIRQHTRHALSFLLVLLTEVMVYINTPSGRIQEQNRYQFLKQALVCTLHPRTFVNSCGNITSQRVEITGKISNFEWHLENFMDYLENPKLYCDALSNEICGSVDF